MFNDKKTDKLFNDGNGGGHDSLEGLLYIIAFVIILYALMFPIGVLLGVIICFLISDKLALKISGVVTLLGIIAMLISKNSVSEQIKGYFHSFKVLLMRREFERFFTVGFSESFFYITLTGIGVFLGWVIHLILSSRTNAQIARSQARKRVDKYGKEISLKEKFNIIERKVKEHTHEEVQGTVIGKSEKEQIIITDEEATGHGAVWGTTGSGKTTVLENFCESCSSRRIPLFYVDGKGDRNFPGELRALAKKYNVPFYHFDLRGEMSKLSYNPLKNGNETNIKEKLIDLTDWESPHYKHQSERTIIFIIDVLDQYIRETRGMNDEELQEYFSKGRRNQTIVKNVKDINTIHQLLRVQKLNDVVKAIKNKELKEDFLESVRLLNEEWIQGFEGRMALLTQSRKMRNILKEDKNGLDLKDVIEKKGIVLFSLNALEDKSVTQMVGRLIVKDINTVISFKKDNSPVYAIYDEHASYVTEDIENQFAMARSYGLRIITSTQEISDYKKVNDVVLDKVLGNTNFKMILRQNNADNAELICKTIGTKKASNKTWSTDFFGRFKGMGVKEVEEFIIHPNVIKSFKLGEAALIKKIPDTKVYPFFKTRKVQIETFEEDNFEKEEVIFEDEKKEEKRESVLDGLDWSTTDDD